MNDESKSLIEDAAKLLGYTWSSAMYRWEKAGIGIVFNPFNPERGDLEKLMDAARLTISYSEFYVEHVYSHELFHFTKGDHASKALAVLRAASAVYKSRGGV